MLIVIIIIVTLIVINSYIIIKDNDNDNDDGNNAQNKDNKKYLKEIKKESPCEWSFLTITITITTNKTLITGKTLTGEEKKTNNNTYLLHPNYEKTSLSNVQRKHHVY